MSVGIIIGCIVIALIVAFVGAGALKSQLQSVEFKSNAAAYKKEGSMQITNRNERYLYNRISKSAKAKKN